jgi:hypothetical protein
MFNSFKRTFKVIYQPNPTTMRTLFLFIMLVGITWLFSCSKDDNSSLPGFPMISSITMGNNPDLNPLELNYNSENKLVNYSFEGTVLHSYTYGNGTVIKKIFGKFEEVLDCEVYTLNNKGQAISCLTFPDGTCTGDSIRTTYEYDENGYMTRMVVVSVANDTAITNYTILDGNVISETSSGDSYEYSYTYDYYYDKSNTIGDENQGIYFLGKQSVNLVRNKISTSVLKTYTYEFDEKGRVSKRSSVPGEDFNYYYSYL